MTEKIRGVNLGAWLVLEKWMAPRLFDRTGSEDEYYLAHDVPEEVYREKILTHRSEFITESDFIRISAEGFNLVRIPVPYFIFGDRTPFIGCIDDLDRAFNWAEAYDLKILIDLHTAPFSQNAFDNGGISGVCKWAQHPEEVEFVQTVLTRLAERYKANDALWGIEVLNEPLTEKMWDIIKPQEQYKPRDEQMEEGSAPITFDFLYGFYMEAYRRLRTILPADKAIVFHDGFDLHMWEAFFKKQSFENVVLDTHHYLMFGDDPTRENLAAYKTHLAQLGQQIEAVSEYVPVVAGEWSLFNKYITGGHLKAALGDTEEEIRSKQEAVRQFYQELWNSSVEAWDKGDGYIYWTYKVNIDTVNDPDSYGWDCWDLSRCLAQSWADLNKPH